MSNTYEYTRNLRDGELVIQDSGGSNSVTVTLDEGDLSWTESKPRHVIGDRGTIDHVRNGNQEACRVRFSLKYVAFFGGSDSGDAVTPVDALKQAGNASGWTSTGDAGEPYGVDLVFTITNPDSSEDNEVITFSPFFYDSLEPAEGDEYSTISCEGVMRGEAPTPTRVAP